MGLIGCTGCSHPARQCCRERGGRHRCKCEHYLAPNRSSLVLILIEGPLPQPPSYNLAPYNFQGPCQAALEFSIGLESREGRFWPRLQRGQKWATHCRQCQVIGRLVAFPAMDFVLVGWEQSGPGNADPVQKMVTSKHLAPNPETHDSLPLRKCSQVSEINPSFLLYFPPSFTSFTGSLLGQRPPSHTTFPPHAAEWCHRNQFHQFQGTPSVCRKCRADVQRVPGPLWTPPPKRPPFQGPSSRFMKKQEQESDLRTLQRLAPQRSLEAAWPSRFCRRDRLTQHQRAP